MKSLGLALAVCVCAGFANAKEGEPVAPTSSETATPAASAPASPTPAESAPAASEKLHAGNKAHAEGMSRKAYVRALTAELRRRTPKTSRHHGSVQVSFTVGASGKVTSHKVVRASDPALPDVVAGILAAVHTPPPPGGSFTAHQEFTFH